MVQELTTLPSASSNFWGGLSKGLAQAGPEELAYQRKRAGLEELGKAENLTPRQLLTKAQGVYGMTPVELENYQKIAALEGQRAPRRPPPVQGQAQASPQAQQYFQPMQKAQDVEFLNNAPNRPNPLLPMQGGAKAQQGKTIAQQQIEAQEASIPPRKTILNELSAHFKTPQPQNPDQREAAIQHVLQMDPSATRMEAEREVDGWYNQELKQAQTARENQQQEKNVRDEVDKEFDEISKKFFEIGPSTQNEKGERIPGTNKTGRSLEDFISGPIQTFIKEKAYEDLEKNPNKNARQIVTDWVKKADKFKEVQGDLKVHANRSIIDSILPASKNNSLEAIKSARKHYKEFDALPELYRKLQTSPKDGGFGLSPGDAAVATYETSAPLKQLLQKYTNEARVDYRKNAVKGIPNADAKAQAKRMASDLIETIGINDSILSFSKQAKDSLPFFDEDAFFSYLRKHEDKIVAPQQQKELIKGKSGLERTWGDIFLFPAFGRSAVHDKIR